MSWAIGYDSHWQRDVGYGVPALCDHPRCQAEIDRGLSYVCGNEPYGGDRGCGLYFCPKHLYIGACCPQLCNRCLRYRPPYKHPKADHPTWMRHKLNHSSWLQWRDENPTEVAATRAALKVTRA